MPSHLSGLEWTQSDRLLPTLVCSVWVCGPTPLPHMISLGLTKQNRWGEATDFRAVLLDNQLCERDAATASGVPRGRDSLRAKNLHPEMMRETNGPALVEYGSQSDPLFFADIEGE